MEFYDAVKSRRTSRKFTSQPVEEEAIRRIIEASYLGPTWNHKRNWHYIILTKQEDKEAAFGFAKKEAEKFDAEKYLTIPRPYPVTPGQKMFAYSMPLQYSMFMEAPYVILPVYQHREISGGKFSHLNMFSTIWCAIENLFLAASAEGLSCAMRIPQDEEHEEIKKRLKVPATYRIPVILGVGYADPSENKPAELTPDYTKQIHYGKWKK